MFKGQSAEKEITKHLKSAALLCIAVLHHLRIVSEGDRVES